MARSITCTEFNILGWTNTSLVEDELSLNFSRLILKEGLSTNEIIEVIEALALLIASSDLSSVSYRAKKLTDLFVTKHPEILLMEYNQPFAASSDTISTNLFSRVALTIDSSLNKGRSHGVVPTPPVLAMDMVRLAISGWISNKLRRSIRIIYNSLFSLRPQSVASEVKKVTEKAIYELVWYDPCVGTGIFPLCIVLVMHELFGKSSRSIIDLIDGCDKDRVSLCVARIRMSFLVSTLFGEPYAHTLSKMSDKFIEGNSLLNFAPSSTCLWQPKIDCGDNRKKDIVIGNPPYIRSEFISAEDSTLLKEYYSMIYGAKADIYHYFIANALFSLKNDGVLCFVSPATFHRSRNAKAIRSFIQDNGAVQSVFDFDELPVFKDAALHPCVYTIVKNGKSNGPLVSRYTELPDTEPILHGLRVARRVAKRAISKEQWVFVSNDVCEILESLSKNSMPLEEYTGAILSGIKTGCREAFYLDKSQVASFSCDNDSAKRIVKLVLPRDIRAYNVRWSKMFIIIVKKDEKLPPDSIILKHLRQYEERLKSRVDIVGHDTWYGLRECKYYSIFEEPKIIYPDIATECRFALDSSGAIIPDGAFMLKSNDLFLLGLLNSTVANLYFRYRCSSIGNPERKGRLRFKKTYVSQFPIPIVANSNKEIVEAIRMKVSEFQGRLPCEREVFELDNLILRAYDLPKRYWDIVHGRHL